MSHQSPWREIRTLRRLGVPGRPSHLGKTRQPGDEVMNLPILPHGLVLFGGGDSVEPAFQSSKKGVLGVELAAITCSTVCPYCVCATLKRPFMYIFASADATDSSIEFVVQFCRCVVCPIVEKVEVVYAPVPRIAAVPLKLLSCWPPNFLPEPLC